MPSQVQSIPIMAMPNLRGKTFPLSSERRSIVPPCKIDINDIYSLLIIAHRHFKDFPFVYRYAFTSRIDQFVWLPRISFTPLGTPLKGPLQTPLKRPVKTPLKTPLTTLLIARRRLAGQPGSPSAASAKRPQPPATTRAP